MDDESTDMVFLAYKTCIWFIVKLFLPRVFDCENVKKEAFALLEGKLSTVIVL